MRTGSETNRDEELTSIYENDSGYGNSKNLFCDPAYFSFGGGVCPNARVENTVCRLRLDQSMPGCKSSCRLVFEVWNRDQGIPGWILRQNRHSGGPIFLWYPCKKG